jgi:hypothetical protein
VDATLSELLLGLDPVLWLAELLLALCLGSLTWVSLPNLQQSSAMVEFTLFCQGHNLSFTEVAGLLTGSVGLLLFDLAAAVGEDDMVEALAFTLAGLILLTGGLSFFLLGLQFLATYSNFGGGSLFRAACVDGLNVVLVFLRAGFCLVRYLFYDLQGELLDLLFRGVDLEDLGLLHPQLAAGLPVTLFLDVSLWLVQLLFVFAKLGLALFLFQLILDTFFLRPAAASETSVPTSEG